MRDGEVKNNIAASSGDSSRIEEHEIWMAIIFIDELGRLNDSFDARHGCESLKLITDDIVALGS